MVWILTFISWDLKPTKKTSKKNASISIFFLAYRQEVFLVTQHKSQQFNAPRNLLNIPFFLCLIIILSEEWKKCQESREDIAALFFFKNGGWEGVDPALQSNMLPCKGLEVCEALGLDLQALEPGCNLTQYQVYACGSKGWKSMQQKDSPSIKKKKKKLTNSN